MLQVVAECLKKYLQVQGLSSVVSWSVCFASAVGIAANYGLMKIPQLGLDGAPLAQAMYQLSIVLSLLWYMGQRKSNDEPVNVTVRRGWNEFFAGSGVFLFLAISGTLTNAVESWRYGGPPRIHQFLC
jgi:MATE family multidrug resistance protein